MEFAFFKKIFTETFINTVHTKKVKKKHSLI